MRDSCCFIGKTLPVLSAVIAVCSQFQLVYCMFKLSGDTMIGHYILAAVTLAMVFIMFLVLSKTLNNIINLLIKMEYSLQRELDLKEEALEVRRLMEEESRKDAELERLKKGE